ncbi:GNAT family N-acetyltransferase, partial [Enterococcus faecalis]|nr:GNAT family N-acetyltransferase [Enterococcus faecalis]
MEKFRKTTEDDLTELMALIEEGIAFLKAQGSPQWQNGYGPKEIQIKEDIAKGESYVLVKDGKI